VSGRFAQEIEAFVKVAKGNADRAVRRICLGVLSNVVIASPVDTGRFRGNWQVGVSAPVISTANSPQKDPGAVISEAAGKLAGVHAGAVVYITNSLPYALSLEFGHSQQAPDGMVRLTFRRIDQIVADATKE
jgi:hypothetical protein